MTRRRRKQAAANGTGIPQGTVAADRTKQVPNNSYDLPPTYYVDRPFKCVDCGAREVWSAKEQKWFYEEAKGSLYATAVRCRPCRLKRREGKDATHGG